jgi:hypothetical protein
VSGTPALAILHDRLRSTVRSPSRTGILHKPVAVQVRSCVQTAQKYNAEPAGTARPAPSALVSMFVLVLTGRQRAPERARPERSARRVFPLLATGLAQLAR